MAKQSLVRQFAQKLASIAHDLKEEHGDTLAQVITYGALLRQLHPGLNKSMITNQPEKLRQVYASLGQLLHLNCEHLQTYYSSLGKDTAIYFHEEFLRAYDKENAIKRGVHYSPPEVVSYMIRGTDDLLQTRLECSLNDALLLDPCCGIGTFPRFIEPQTRYRPQMIGLELNPATCSLASYLLAHCEIIQADSLDEIDLPLNGRPLVVIGNPPYSGHSANSGKVADLLADYRLGLNERNPKWLQDDYVKFIRMAQHRVDQAGRGIVAFITNHSFIFNPTFRAMRASLMQSFDEIYILDLHGNAKKIERISGEPDENVFPIQMGVAISFMVKTGSKPGCKVYYSDIRGKRDLKLRLLSDTTITDTPWSQIQPDTPHFSFIMRNSDIQNEFYSFPSITELFNTSSVGFVTSRDSFAVDSDKEALLQRISDLRDGTLSDEVIRKQLGAGDLDIELARQELRSDPNWQNKATEVLYRPFDRRWAYYSRTIMERPRLPFMENLMKDNIALAIGRAGHATGSDTWDIVFCTDRPTDLNIFRRGGALLLPRWAYVDGEKKSNIKAEGDHSLLFSYIYALLHSNTYRKRYEDMLSLDFPRIPLLRDSEMLHALAELGSKLIDVHLMRDHESYSATPGVETTIGGYRIPGKYRDDRKNRKLTSGEQECFNQITAAVSSTLALQEEIDAVISESPPWGTAR